MQSVVNKGAKVATIQFDLANEQDRLTFIAWLKQLQPSNAESQFHIDRCIQAAGGEPEAGFPGYEMMQQ